MRLTWIALPVLAVAVVGAGLFVASNSTRAVQNPNIFLDMVITGNVYDEATNTMTVGTVEPCLEVIPGQTTTHTHQTHLIIQNVEDLVGFQVRLNYVGDQMRPLSWNASPFMDNNTGQPVGFINLPIDSTSSVHRAVTPAQAIPAAPPDGTNTGQTALVGAAYVGTQGFPISPDTPPKAPTPDDMSYSAPAGGVLGALILQVTGNESGQSSLSMDLDDDTPNPPGSNVVIFTGTGTGTTTMALAESALADGFHGEGVACTQQLPSGTPTPTIRPTDTATPTPLPTATAGPTLPPGVTPTPPPGGVGTPTRTPTPRPGGAGTPTPTPRVTPAALPPTGADDGGWTTLAYVALFATIAIPVSGAAYGVVRLRRK